MNPNFWPIVSIVASLATMVIGALLARWTAGVVQNLKSDIRIAILEAENRNTEKYATKEYVDKQVDLAGRVENGFANVRHMLRPRGGAETEAIVR